MLSVDGREVAREKIPHTIPFLLTIDETFDIGVDTRTPVDDNDYQVPFRFKGTLSKVTIKLGREQLTEEDRRIMHEHIVHAKD